MDITVTVKRLYFADFANAKLFSSKYNVEGVTTMPPRPIHHRRRKMLKTRRAREVVIIKFKLLVVNRYNKFGLVISFPGGASN